eukprot:TRINITY_DN129_c0_g1_i1.p1 TRINITY_DN129_c0_g1~~TRINITY_DN129_c0_g1_i1.p1  ORF type:complete len:518 (-),score=165.53 TRINITY_DN129_c0_g1_i1:226-1779(-)
MSQYAKSKQTTRRTDFKKTVDSQDARRKREESTVRIRKNKRAESFQKRRREDLSSPSEALHFGNVSERLQELEELVQDVVSEDLTRQLEATTKFRKLLSIEHNPPIQDVIDAGIVPRFVEFLGRGDCPQLQFEASWAITNIASGSPDQTRYILDSGAVPCLRDLLLSKVDDVREQAVWALGNIAGDSPACRDFVLKFNVIDSLVANLNDSTKLSMLRNATWTLSNFCRGKPQPPLEHFQKILPILKRLIYSGDDEVLTDACWALSYLSDGPNERIQAVIEAGISRRLVELLLHQSPSVQTPALRSIGNIVTGDDSQTQIIINNSVLPCLLQLLSSQKKAIRKEACWTISNITAGTPHQIQAVIDAQIFPRLIALLKNSDFDIRKEAAWALSNASSGGDPEQIKYMVEQHLIEPLCELLTCPDPRIVLVALEGLENVLRSGETFDINPYVGIIEDCNGLDKIENLQNHSNNEIYEKVISILEEYFGAEEEDQNTAPNINAANNSFAFGVGSNVNNFNF